MSSRGRERGLTLIELMIGLTVGLIVLTGASILMVSQLGDHRRLALETRTEQDVRALAEIMMRELRDAGSWQNAGKSAWSDSNTSPKQNPYAEIGMLDGGTGITFAGTAAKLSDADNDKIDSAERRGFKLEDGILKSLNGAAGWQPVSDPQTLKINSLRFDETLVTQALESVCSRPCDGTADCPPRLEIRQLRVRLDAQAAHDAKVKRNLDFNVRLQADRVDGKCPS